MSDVGVKGNCHLVVDRQLSQPVCMLQRMADEVASAQSQT